MRADGLAMDDAKVRDQINDCYLVEFFVDFYRFLSCQRCEKFFGFEDSFYQISRFDVINENHQISKAKIGICFLPF